MVTGPDTDSERSAGSDDDATPAVAGASPRILAFALGGAFAVETTMYSALTPMLPYFVDRLDVGKTAAGILGALHAIGVIAGALAGARLVSRFGVRSTTVAGMAALGISTCLLGFADSIVVLDAARFAQGTAAGCVWAGALAWFFLVNAEGRGGALGAAMSAAVIGTIVGPILGTGALLDPALVFSVVGALITVGAILLSRLSVVNSRPPRSASLARVLTHKGILSSAWMVTFTGMIGATVHILCPLRLDDLGFSHGAIGLVFLVASILAATLSPGVGRAVDRLGGSVPLVFGLGLIATCSVVVALAASSWPVAGATIGIEGLGLLLTWVPAMLVLVERAEHAGASPALAAALINISNSLGLTVGGATAASAADALGTDMPVFLAVTGAAAATSVTVWRASTRSRHAADPAGRSRRG